MRRRIPTLAFTTLGIASALIGLTATAAFAATTEDDRAVAFDGNATTCGDVGFENSTLLFTNGDADNSDENVSGDVHNATEGQFPGYSADANSLLDVTVDDGFVIDAIVVKAGNAYNVYGPEDAPLTNLRAPLTGQQLTNIPTISHWYVCYSEGPPPPPETGDVELDKVTTGGTAPAADTAFSFTVDCESGTETSPVTVAPNEAAKTVAEDVVEGDSCTITETDAKSATTTAFVVTGGTVEATTANSVTFTVDGASVSVVATNGYPEVLTTTTTTTAPTTTTTAAQVLGVQVTTSTTAPAAEVQGVQLARTGSPAQFWYLLAGVAFLLGGLSLYGSTALRGFYVKR